MLDRDAEESPAPPRPGGRRDRRRRLHDAAADRRQPGPRRHLDRGRGRPGLAADDPRRPLPRPPLRSLPPLARGALGLSLPGALGVLRPLVRQLVLLRRLALSFCQVAPPALPIWQTTTCPEPRPPAPSR